MTGDGYFGERIAARYDDDESGMFAPELIESTVDFLAGLAGGGAALEFGIGTGRIALPLAAGACRSTVSICRGQWSNGCGQSRARTISA
ncbi:MAG: hypothetical protein R2849_07945 [Thermomicrobiales bacterium]